MCERCAEGMLGTDRLDELALRGFSDDHALIIGLAKQLKMALEDRERTQRLFQDILNEERGD